MVNDYGSLQIWQTSHNWKVLVFFLEKVHLNSNLNDTFCQGVSNINEYETRKD